MNDFTQSAEHPTNAHPARVYNVWLGGKDHYEVDQEAAELAARANPTIVPSVRANRAFLGRAVRHLATSGIRQFLDIGTGVPAADNTHEVAQRADPDARVVYVDNDPIVLAHARALLVSGPGGQTDYVQADARDVDAILDAASDTLDLDQPVGLMLVAILQYIKDSEDPWDITRRLLDRLAPGSYLVLSHPAADVTAPEVAESMRIYNERAASHASATPRTRGQVEGFFEGLELLTPGVVTLTRWRPDPADTPDDTLPMWCGVARKA
ncbi:Trans-aconitate 2-methyltransferase [Streptomyces sp. YIM 130001]|uniref:SAM-dependent methyltransferase n=1 Tax=Streptomyces sp. YIM 130001 TaxID=2259644 RepID=UPI000E6592C4|nr:SAM-dependent methyltransferase [Streptomyces sp. YIM 130001]RII20226.1 Trans-aconitate 2-methyltransferase [Streptomyces sp. YIM 130001]